jgi:hypothetical protein
MPSAAECAAEMGKGRPEEGLLGQEPAAAAGGSEERGRGRERAGQRRGCRQLRWWRLATREGKEKN